MIKIHESGLLRIWQRHWWPKDNFCDRGNLWSKPISLADVQSAFYVCGIGIFIGAVALVTELCVWRWKKRRKQPMLADITITYTKTDSVQD